MKPPGFSFEAAVALNFAYYNFCKVSELSNAVANKEYIERLQMAIRHLHKLESKHLETVPVKETFQGQTVWAGEVEVFSVSGHLRAKKCYAWSVKQETPQERFTAVLELPPVKSPIDAVRVSILAAYKKEEQ